MPAGLNWLFEHVPHYMHWYRFWLFWNTAEGLLPAATVDPDWPDKTKSVSEANDQIRALLTVPAVAVHATARTCSRRSSRSTRRPPKRVLIDNGAWARR